MKEKPKNNQKNKSKENSNSEVVSLKVNNEKGNSFINKKLLVYNDIEKDILSNRAKELSKSNKNIKKIDDIELLVFSINSIKYSFEIKYIDEIQAYTDPIFVPNTPSFIIGLINIRGNIVSVNDFTLFIGEEKTKRNIKSSSIIVLKNEKLELGIVCDEIVDIIKISKNNIFPSILTDENSSKYFYGITNDMVNVIDADFYLKDERLVLN